MDIKQLIEEAEVNATKSFYLDYLQRSPVNDQIKNFLSRDHVFHREFDIYPVYPHLFRPYFSQIPIHQLRQLATAGYLYYLSLVSIDRLMDSQKQKFDPQNLAIIFFCQEECIKMLTHLFGAENEAFWKIWNLRKEEQQYGFYLEKKLNYNSTVKTEDYEKIAAAKSAVAKVAIDASFLLNGEKNAQAYKNILAAHDLFSVGLQIIDDLQDLDKDIEANQYNIAYARLREICQEDGKAIEELIQKKEAKKYLYFRNGFELLMEQANNYFHQAVDLMGPYSPSGWTKLLAASLQDTRLKVDRIKGHFSLLKLRHQLKQVEPKHTDLAGTLIQETTDKPPIIKKSLEFLLDQWTRSFPDLPHIMFLSKWEGFGKEDGLFVGDVFQRAIIGDILCDIRDAWGLPLADILEKEKMQILQQRNETDAIGGWRYFQDLYEIAPDIDDLGQILQFFTRINAQELIQGYCIPPINTCLANNVCDNGGIETWIIPKNNRTALQKLQVTFNEERWGTGPDIEVVANFLYGLSLLDHQKYQQTISQGIDFLMQNQMPGGWWDSRWYYGRYYGTYTCMRLLVQDSQGRDEYADHLEKVSSFVVESQNEDGGWNGFGKPQSDPLNTALAILCLATIKGKDQQGIILQKAKQYLKATQNKNGSWPAVNFIKPRVDEPYNSSALTTAYVIKALTKLIN